MYDNMSVEFNMSCLTVAVTAVLGITEHYLRARRLQLS